MVCNYCSKEKDELQLVLLAASALVVVDTGKKSFSLLRLISGKW